MRNAWFLTCKSRIIPTPPGPEATGPQPCQAGAALPLGPTAPAFPVLGASAHLGRGGTQAPQPSLDLVARRVPVLPGDDKGGLSVAQLRPRGSAKAEGKGREPASFVAQL